MEKAVYETTIWYTGNLVGYIVETGGLSDMIFTPV